MEFKRLDKRKGSGATSIRSRYAYLIHLPDIDYFPPTNDKGVRLEGDIVLQEGRTMIPVYLTNPSQEYSYETQGADDEKTFRVKFTGTHPGTELEALEFSKNLIEESFLVLIPGCEKNTPGKLLGQIENPMIFTSTHKAAKDGDKFTFNFEQRIGSEFIYFSYGGIVSLPPEGGDPDIPVPSPGFDPSKWAKRDASNIEGNNVLLWREALRIYNENRVLTIGAITATTTSIDIALHSSGINSVEMNGNTLSKNTPEHWEFPEVTAEKVFQIYAEDTPAIFGLAEDGEEIPAGVLIVATIALSEAGEVVINEPIDGFQLKSNQAWVRTWVNYTTDIQTLSIHHSALRFIVQAGHDGVKIGGFQFYKPEFLYDGVEITLRNETLGDLELASATESGYNLVPINPADLPAQLKIGESCTLAYDAYANVFNVQKMGSEPDLSGYATTPQLDAEITERALQANNINLARIQGDNNLQGQISFLSALLALKQDAIIKRNLQQNNINFCGYAPEGSAENAAVWTVTKITVAAAGTITKETLTDITWSSVPF